MKTIEEKLLEDQMVFGQSAVENIILNTFRKRIRAAWSVLTGGATIVIYRVPPKKLFNILKTQEKKS